MYANRCVKITKSPTLVCGIGCGKFILQWGTLNFKKKWGNFVLQEKNEEILTYKEKMGRF
jgi:hypothetical protein